jgi:CHAT domain-containing protein/Tfp pilus assembly protein PilF
LISRAEAAPKVGVVVETVTENYAGHRAGLKAGDVILAWRREASPPANPTEARGAIGSWFDFEDARTEQAPRGPFWLRGVRAGAPFAAKIPPGPWETRVRPARMPRAVGSLYEEGDRRIAKNEIEPGVAAWRQAAAEAGRNQRWELASWLASRIGDVRRSEKKWGEAATAYEASAALAERHGLPLVAAWAWDMKGKALQKQNALVEATESLERALALRETHAPGTLRVAVSLNNLGNFWSDRGDPRRAEGLFTRSLEVITRWAPESHYAFFVLRNLAVILGDRGDLGRKEAYYRQALALSRKLDMGELQDAKLLNGLGELARTRGDVILATELLTDAHTILERLEPESILMGATLNNLGLVALEQGDLALAEKSLKRSLHVYEKVSPDSRLSAGCLLSLGSVARDRGDLEAAESYYRRSLLIEEKLAPGGLGVAGCLAHLGDVAKGREQLSVAEDYYKGALALYARHAPGGVLLASTLADLGDLARSRHDYAEAERVLTEALSIQERLSPGSLQEAWTLMTMAALDAERHDTAAAEARLVPALATVQRLAPGSAFEARCLSALSEIRRAGGRLREALDLLGQAVAALEAQRGRLGGSEEARAMFAGQHADLYRSYVEALVESNRGAEAFHVLERSRARSFLAQLAERDIVFDREIPADLERERRAADAAYDRTQAQLVRADPKDQARIETLLSQLRGLRVKQDDVAQRLREASPRLAALKYPEPLDVTAAQRALEVGTVLLSYSVGPKKTLLFVVSASPAARVAVYTVAVDRDRLRSDVQTLRGLIAGPGPAGAAFYAQARQLFARLIAPARKEISASRRVVICPDDQLHALPFGALFDRKRGFFVQWKPIHLVASATVYAELLRSRQATLAAGHPFQGFGNPTYADPDMATRFHLTPLPGTGREVRELATLFGEKAVVYTGAEATEGRVKSLDREAHYLHFACHGFVDDRFPLNSGLALTMSEKPAEGGDNGLLQAWEIIEQVRIRADLVALSACETGLGKELAGEGILGLTRAFQFAGAQSVLASLWSVPDKATTRLMTRLYRYLQQGYSKDTALRAAQIDLIEGRLAGDQATAFKQPLAWAAFQLVGDWR